MSRVRYIDWMGRIDVEDPQLGDEFLFIARARVDCTRQENIDVTNMAGRRIVGGEVEAELMLYDVRLEKLA